MNDQKMLAGQIALITGAARGIGAGIAVELARAGADVAINDLNTAEETLTRCRNEGVNVFDAKGDVSDQASMEQLVDRIEAELGPISILVSNAAYSDRELFYEANMPGFQRTIDVCMWGPFYLCRAVARKMIARGEGGNMVFISSPHATKPIPGAMAYNMAKAALDQMARTAACELAEHRIRVNLVHPGWTDTPGERKFFFEEELRDRGQELPFGRLARPEDIAHAVTFLCDPRSDYITGSTLLVDGGILLPFQEMYRVKNRPK